MAESIEVVLLLGPRHQFLRPRVLLVVAPLAVLHAARGARAPRLVRPFGWPWTTVSAVVYGDRNRVATHSRLISGGPMNP